VKSIYRKKNLHNGRKRNFNEYINKQKNTKYRQKTTHRLKQKQVMQHSRQAIPGDPYY